MNAKTDLGNTLLLANETQEIWVATGVYTHSTDPAQSFYIRPGVEIYGGFDPASGVDEFEERDWDAYPTVLSGDIDGDDTTDANGVVTHTTMISGTNSYHVVISFNLTETAVLDGFIITAGQANGSAAAIFGGGMYNNASSPTIRNITFSGNWAKSTGGGMYNTSSSPTLSNVTFTGNWANDSGGGGMYSYKGQIHLTDVTFIGNHSDDQPGGGMRNSSSDVVLTSVTFISNTANNSAGGGMHTNLGSVQLMNVAFLGNSAGTGGGMSNSDTDAVLTDVSFVGNTASYGAGLDSYGGGTLSLINGTFSGNLAELGGGGVRLHNVVSATLTNLAFSGNAGGNWGGGIYNTGSNPLLTNVTFSGNLANYGGGMANLSGSSAVIRNTIFWSNVVTTSNPAIFNNTSTSVLTNTLIQGGCAISGATCYGTTLTADPQFFSNPDAGDGKWWTLADNDYGDLRLLLSSPAINQGSNDFVSVATDLAGADRIAHAIVDLGAYERQLGELYVDDTAPGANTGLNWTDAFFDLQDALAAALPGDEIWVATGIYTPGETVADTFALAPGVAIYGGFAATETLRTERDWDVNLTILSGDIGGDDGALAGVVTDTDFINGDNSYHVVTSTGVLSNTILDGFTITAGQADGAYAFPCAANCGGGMYNYASSSPTLANLAFSGNAADGVGGGMSNATGSNPILSDVTFAGNSASRGGGMANTYISHPSLVRVTFIGNNADRGGGLYNFQSSPTLQDADFTDNFGAIEGGGIYNLTDSNPVIVSAVFHLNKSNSIGGGISNDESSPVLTDVTFTGNSASSGGGMANIDNSNVLLTAVTFSGNTASQSGGGIYNSLSTNPIITDTIFISNTAGTKGGAISHLGGGGILTLLNTTIYGNSANIGGGLYSEAILNLTNTIFVGNVAYGNARGPVGGEGGAIYSAGTFGMSALFNITIANNQAYAGGAIYSEDESTLNLYNSILWANQATLNDEMFIDDGTVGITNTLVTDGCPWGATICTNVFAIDPQFEQTPDAGDGDWLTLADNDYGDLHLRILSPAIDAGNSSYVSVAVDLDGNIRIVNTFVDLGAYEQLLAYRYFMPLISR